MALIAAMAGFSGRFAINALATGRLVCAWAGRDVSGSTNLLDVGPWRFLWHDPSPTGRALSSGVSPYLLLACSIGLFLSAYRSGADGREWFMRFFKEHR